MSFVRFPPATADPAEVGGKAAALTELAKRGFEPPAFFVIAPDGFARGASGPLPAAGLDVLLSNALPKIGPGPYAVRSSGRAEDGSEHSHAGQFDTLLNVPARNVLDAAAQVWMSGFSETVETYRAKTTGDAAEAPAIVVQQMIPAEAAGVAFSADPVSGQRGTVVISAIAGLGDQLVSGEEDGEDWVLDHAGTFLSQPGHPQVLTPAQAQQIAALAQWAEEAFGAPQDIEWALHQDNLHILQSRPITTPLLAEAQSDSTLTIFDNSNIVESYPGLVSPLTYSFALHVYARVYRAFVALLGVRSEVIDEQAAVFDNLLGRVDGRVYYNLVNWYRALALLPGFSLNRDHMETMMGVSEPMPREITDAIGPPPARGLAKLREYGRLARVAGGLVWQAVLLPRTRRSFYDRLNTALAGDLDLATANPTQLAAEYRRIESTLLNRWDAPLINDFLCMMAFGASRKLLEKWLGTEGLQLHNDLMIGQGDIVSAEPAQRIAALGALTRDAGLSEALMSGQMSALDGHPEIKAGVDSYLEKFGDRCTEELKLESIALSDDPTSLLQAIAASAERPKTERAEPSDPDWAALFEGKPIRRIIAERLIGWTKARVRDRENLRFERTRIFGHARRVFLAIGREFAARGLLETPRDIFYLTTAEVLGAIEGFALSPDIKGTAASRKAEDMASASRADPPERIEIRGPAIAPRWQKTHVARDDGLVKTATGCSAGQVQARARVIRDPRKEALAPGDILVARHTDPGWIAVFSNASAIVVERGSLLSHSAIVARELGIPCVVGLKGATQWIQDGEKLLVDGATGRVERLNGPE
ncbi:MAG: PEP/pyruvate-binding domain-containing protein [Pseudomonadota bacterium]